VIEDGHAIILSIEKSRDAWWSSFLVGDAETDVTKVESRKRIDEYDDEAQAAIRKILYSENQKMLGLKTPAESEREQKLREAWDADGSPFKGTPFDPTVLTHQ
jgi:hypothetical protein